MIDAPLCLLLSRLVTSRYGTLREHVGRRRLTMIPAIVKFDELNAFLEQYEQEHPYNINSIDEQPSFEDIRTAISSHKRTRAGYFKTPQLASPSLFARALATRDKDGMHIRFPHVAAFLGSLWKISSPDNLHHMTQPTVVARLLCCGCGGLEVARTILKLSDEKLRNILISYCHTEGFAYANRRPYILIPREVVHALHDSRSSVSWLCIAMSHGIYESARYSRSPELLFSAAVMMSDCKALDILLALPNIVAPHYVMDYMVHPVTEEFAEKCAESHLQHSLMNVFPEITITLLRMPKYRDDIWECAECSKHIFRCVYSGVDDTLVTQYAHRVIFPQDNPPHINTYSWSLRMWETIFALPDPPDYLDRWLGSAVSIFAHPVWGLYELASRYLQTFPHTLFKIIWKSSTENTILSRLSIFPREFVRDRLRTVDIYFTLPCAYVMLEYAADKLPRDYFSYIFRERITIRASHMRNIDIFMFATIKMLPPVYKNKLRAECARRGTAVLREALIEKISQNDFTALHLAEYMQPTKPIPDSPALIALLIKSKSVDAALEFVHTLFDP